MNLQGLETLVWDLDGTVIDSFGIFSEVLGNVVPNYGRQMPNEQTIRANYHGSLHDSIDAALGGIKNDELEKIVADFLSIQDAHYEVVEHHIFPDALGLARRARAAGMYQVLVTNRNHEGRLNASPRSIVERSSLKTLIDEVVCGDDTEHRKPKPAVIEHLLKTGKVRGEKAVVVGDQFVDAQFAHNLGSTAILVERSGLEIAHLDTFTPEDRDRIVIVSSLDEITL